MDEDHTTPEYPPPPSDLWPSRSENFGKVAAAFANAQGNIEHAIKDSVNSHFKNKYADLAGVIDAYRTQFRAQGLSVLQPIVPSPAGSVCIQTIVLHSSGEWLADRGLTMPAQGTAQGYGSALTYARRYAMAALVGIAQDDDDGNAGSGKTPAKATPAKKPDPKLATPAARDKMHERIKALPDEMSEQIGSRLRAAGVVWTTLSTTQLAEVTEWVVECEGLASAT